MQVHVKIEPRAAILARKAKAGVLVVEITDEHLRDLEEPLLELLADVVDNDEVLEGPLVSDASFEVVKAVLTERLVRKQQATKDVEKQKADEKAAAARVAEEELVRRRMYAARDAENRKAIATWVEEHCDEEMKDRLDAGFLPDEEIIDEAMHQLFEINEDEYVPLKKEQACDCERGCAGMVKFTVTPILPGVATLDSRQFASLERVKESAPTSSTIEPRLHKASCPECKCTPIARASALVTLEWNGWLLKKEYQLG